MVWIYENADFCLKKNKFIVLLIIIFGTLSFPIVHSWEQSIVMKVSVSLSVFVSVCRQV